MKRTFVIHGSHVVVFMIGLVIMAWAAAVYHPPTWLNVGCSLFYGWKIHSIFPWATVRQE